MELRPDPWIGGDGRSVDNRWEVTILADKIMVWSPLSTGVFSSKVQEKPGRATGGFLYFDQIDQIHRDGRYWLNPDAMTPEVAAVAQRVADVARQTPGDIPSTLTLHIANVVKQIPSGSPLTLTLWSSSQLSLGGQCLEFDFADVAAARQFCDTLTARLPAYWAQRAESASQSLARGTSDPDLSKKLAKAAAVEIPKVQAELSKLGAIDWSTPGDELSISLAEAGCPIRPHS